MSIRTARERCRSVVISLPLRKTWMPRILKPRGVRTCTVTRRRLRQAVDGAAVVVLDVEDAFVGAAGQYGGPTPGGHVCVWPWLVATGMAARMAAVATMGANFFM